MGKILRKITSVLPSQTDKDASVLIADKQTLDTYNADANNPYLVSFPRTGSHWFRMVAELYFERPTLVRAFYYPEKTDYLFLHTHDMELDVTRQNVIYLYREPVATIYSQLNYHQEDTGNPDRIMHWADLYGRHLDRWLHQESFTTHKTIITYEMMRKDMTQVFTAICKHYNTTLDTEKLAAAVKQVTPEEVKRKTHHDKQVIQLASSYQMSREEFREQHASLVWKTVLADRSHLKANFAAALIPEGL